MLRVSAFTAITAIVLGAAIPASAQVKLEHKLADGDQAKTVINVKTSQTLTLAGMDIDTASEQTMTLLSVNGQRADDGTIRVSHKMESMQSTVSLPGGVEISFDSANADAPRPGTQFDMILDIFGAMSKSKWTAVHDASNRVVSVEGRDDVLESLDANVRQALERQLDGEYLKEQSNNELDRIPSKPVSIGDAWELKHTLRLEAGQTMTFTSTYEYGGTVEKEGQTLDLIKSKMTDVSYATEADAPLKALDSDLKIAESEGRILFDRKIGQVVMGKDRVRITGTLKLEINGTELPGKLDLTMETSSQRQ